MPVHVRFLWAAAEVILNIGLLRPVVNIVLPRRLGSVEVGGHCSRERRSKGTVELQFIYAGSGDRQQLGSIANQFNDVLPRGRNRVAILLVR